eukprot:2672376-Amphidinium_carterae.2
MSALPTALFLLPSGGLHHAFGSDTWWGLAGDVTHFGALWTCWTALVMVLGSVTIFISVILRYMRQRAQYGDALIAELLNSDQPTQVDPWNEHFAEQQARASFLEGKRARWAGGARLPAKRHRRVCVAKAMSGKSEFDSLHGLSDGTETEIKPTMLLTDQTSTWLLGGCVMLLWFLRRRKLRTRPSTTSVEGESMQVRDPSFYASTGSRLLTLNAQHADTWTGCTKRVRRVR